MCARARVALLSLAIATGGLAGCAYKLSDITTGWQVAPESPEEETSESSAKDGQSEIKTAERRLRIRINRRASHGRRQPKLRRRRRHPRMPLRQCCRKRPSRNRRLLRRSRSNFRFAWQASFSSRRK